MYGFARKVPSTLEDMIEEILKHSFDNVYKDAYWEELRKNWDYQQAKAKKILNY